MASTEPVRSLDEALKRLGRAPAEMTRHPILHGPAGTLFALALLEPSRAPQWAGVWIEDGRATFLVPVEVPVRVSAGHGLSADAARLVDLIAEAIRRYIEEAERLDARLAGIQELGLSAPEAELWKLRRETANLRMWIARAIVIVGEAEGPFVRAFPGGAERAMPSVLQELERTRELVADLQQALSDLLLMRNAEQSNRIAETANRLSEFSNQIAVLTNTSNIRMLGITYVALVLGLVSAVVLIPNTAATILGMPSAAWVPGLWVDAIVAALAIVPIAIVFSRPWVQRMLRDLRSSTGRTAEGIRDLPEIAAPLAPPDSGSASDSRTRAR